MILDRLAHDRNSVGRKPAAQIIIARQYPSRNLVMMLAPLDKARIMICRNDIDHIGFDIVIPGQAHAVGYDCTHVIESVRRIERGVTRNYLPLDVLFYFTVHACKDNPKYGSPANVRIIKTGVLR